MIRRIVNILLNILITIGVLAALALIATAVVYSPIWGLLFMVAAFIYYCVDEEMAKWRKKRKNQ